MREASLSCCAEVSGRILSSALIVACSLPGNKIKLAIFATYSTILCLPLEYIYYILYVT